MPLRGALRPRSPSRSPARPASCAGAATTTSPALGRAPGTRQQGTPRAAELPGSTGASSSSAGAPPGLRSPGARRGEPAARSPRAQSGFRTSSPVAASARSPERSSSRRRPGRAHATSPLWSSSLGRNLHAVAVYDVSTPASDDAGTDGEFRVGAERPSAFNRRQALAVVRRVSVVGDLPPRRVTARVLGGAVSGTVRDDFGHPVSEAPARLLRRTGSGWRVAQKGTTSTSGRYVFQLPARGSYRVVASLCRIGCGQRCRLIPPLIARSAVGRRFLI